MSDRKRKQGNPTQHHHGCDLREKKDMTRTEQNRNALRCDIQQSQPQQSRSDAGTDRHRLLPPRGRCGILSCSTMRPARRLGRCFRAGRATPLRLLDGQPSPHEYESRGQPRHHCALIGRLSPGRQGHWPVNNNITYN